MRPIGAQAVRLVLAGSLALGAASAGCTWRRDLRPLYPATLPADQRVEVWRGGRRLVLHHVTTDSSAIRGSARAWPRDCVSCRVAIPLAEADSVVMVNADPFWGILGMAAAAVAVFGQGTIVPCWMGSRYCD